MTLTIDETVASLGISDRFLRRSFLISVSQNSRSNVRSSSFCGDVSKQDASPKNSAVKLSMTAFFFFYAPRQFDFVFRYDPAPPFLPYLCLSPARRSKFYGSYFLFNADAVSGTSSLCRSSTLSCLPSPPSSPPTAFLPPYARDRRIVVASHESEISGKCDKIQQMDQFTRHFYRRMNITA